MVGGGGGGGVGSAESVVPAGGLTTMTGGEGGIGVVGRKIVPVM